MTQPLARAASVLIIFGLLAPLLLIQPVATSAVAPATDPFARTWARTDQPVASGAVSRTWMWGPEANTEGIWEDYADSPGGTRNVQYFDKSRMEITDPDAVDDGLWYVTNGLLVRELITGQMQVGDTTFRSREPANVNVAGDADDATGPTYRSFLYLLGRGAGDRQSPVQRVIRRNGNVTLDSHFAQYNVDVISDPGANHWMAKPFWDFMTVTGTIYADGRHTTGPLFLNPYYATGLPILDPFWANVKVGGIMKDVLIQCFERRCLTYTPSNPEGWQVEMGNVGQHYYAWRYDAPAAQPQIAFVSTRDGNSELYLMNPDGTNQRNLTNHPADDGAASLPHHTRFAWSPDGNRLAFMTNRNGMSEVYIVNDIVNDDALQHRLTDRYSVTETPSWSPDGRYIAVETAGNISVIQVSNMYIVGGTGEPGYSSGPTWSPDGSEIAFVSHYPGGAGYGLFVMDVANSSLRQLATCKADNSAVTWSPDGQQLAFISRHADGSLPEICVVNADGTNPHNLIPTSYSPLGTPNHYAMGRPAWSPDGTRIAFAHLDDGGATNRDISVAWVDGYGHYRLASTYVSEDFDPAWSPDGTQIAFVSDRDGNQEIYVVNIDGTNLQRLTWSAGNDRSPAWQPGR